MREHNDITEEHPVAGKKTRSIILTCALITWLLLVVVFAWIYCSIDEHTLWRESRAQPWYEAFRKVMKTTPEGEYLNRYEPQNFVFASKGTLYISPGIFPDSSKRLRGIQVSVAPWQTKMVIQGTEISLERKKLHYVPINPKTGTHGEPILIKTAAQLVNVIERTKEYDAIGIIIGRCESEWYTQPAIFDYLIARFQAGDIYLTKQVYSFGFFDFYSDTTPVFFSSQDPLSINFEK